MYCPSCAAKNEPGVKFCRSCGQDLTLISRALSKSGPVRLLSQITKELKQDKELRQQPRLTRGLYWAAISLFFFVAWSLRIYANSSHFSSVEVLGLINAFIFLGIGVREFVRYIVLPERSDEYFPPVDQQQVGSMLNLDPGERSDKKVSLSTAPVVEHIQPAVPSVTESTTQHLGAKYQENK